jgi:hypothetical protein
VNDQANVRDEMMRRQMTQLLKRVIPGNAGARNIAEFKCEALERLGMNFLELKFLGFYPAVISTILSSPIFPSAKEPYRSIATSGHDWSVAVDMSFGTTGAQAVWFFRVLDVPDSFLESLRPGLTEGTVVWKPGRYGIHVLAIQGPTVRALAKHGGVRGDLSYETHYD